MTLNGWVYDSKIASPMSQSPVSTDRRHQIPHEYDSLLFLPYGPAPRHWLDRKSTRLNSSHLVTSSAVFCLKKKTNISPEEVGISFNRCAGGMLWRGQEKGAARIGFFFNDTATTEIYTLSLHDALPF